VTEFSDVLRAGEMIAKQRPQLLIRTWLAGNERGFEGGEPSVEDQHIVSVSLRPSALKPQLDDPSVLLVTLEIPGHSPFSPLLLRPYPL